MFSKSRNLLTKHARRFTNSVKESRLANINQTDCLRFAFVYGGCGTFASYLHVTYKDAILTFEWTPPTPERFVFCTWCWAMGGMTSWLLFWTRPQALILASSSALSYGLFNGVKTSLLSMGCATLMLSFWSLYFDAVEYREAYREWHERQRQMTPQMLSFSTQSTEGMQASRVIDIIEEDESLVENFDGEEHVGGKFVREKRKKENPNQKPYWNWEDSVLNMKQPTKAFLYSHAAIWLICGGLTGMVAIRMIMANTLAAEAGASVAVLPLMAIASSKRKRDDDDDEDKD